MDEVSVWTVLWFSEFIRSSAIFNLDFTFLFLLKIWLTVQMSHTDIYLNASFFHISNRELFIRFRFFQRGLPGSSWSGCQGNWRLFVSVIYLIQCDEEHAYMLLCNWFRLLCYFNHFVFSRTWSDDRHTNNMIWFSTGIWITPNLNSKLSRPQTTR